MHPLIWIAIGVSVLMLAIVLEGKRQERKYGPPSGGSLLRTGMIDLQRHLEPERKMEILLEEAEESEQGEAGEPPTPGCGDGSGEEVVRSTDLRDR